MNKYGLKRKDEDPREGRMDDGEDEEEESVKKHARHEEGNMAGSSSTNPMPMQERSPAPIASTETGQEEVSAAGRKRNVDENWDEIAAKIRRSGAGRQRESDGQKDEDMLMIMDLMCEEATDDQGNINEYKEAKLEETFDWGQHPRTFWTDAYDEECQSKIYDELTGHELEQGGGAEGKDERDRRSRQHGRLGDCTSFATHCQDRAWAHKGPLG